MSFFFNLNSINYVLILRPMRWKMHKFEQQGGTSAQNTAVNVFANN